MVEVVPAVLAETPAKFAESMKKISGFAKRVHVDITDGDFAPSRTINLAQIYTPDGTQLDLHLMMRDPASQLNTAISLHPHLVIWHFESNSDHQTIISDLEPLGIKIGLAILPQTTVEQIRELIPKLDHVLVFTGHLGYYGGEMQAENLGKINEIKALNSAIEVSVDGGVNERTAPQAAAAGADILISGGFIVKSDRPKAAYAKLTKLAQGVRV